MVGVRVEEGEAERLVDGVGVTVGVREIETDAVAEIEWEEVGLTETDDVTETLAVGVTEIVGLDEGEAPSV
jgi:hypothetical protein